jgi:putative PIN family toxin of toxin-antitoxin system
MSGPPVALKAVFDCNVFLQALGNPRGAAGACLEAVWDRRVQLLVDRALLDELSDVASRPELARKLRILTSRFHRLMEQLKNIAVLVHDVPESFSLPRDPSDAHYVNLALVTGAFLVVSRDKDLLDLMASDSADGLALRALHPSFRVLSPPDFLKLLPPTPPPPTTTTTT